MTLNFYSTKRSSNVNIPRNKVCGYKIINSWMKDGFSNGIRSGADNGVVDQKLSRFATETERLEAGNICSGNTNLLNPPVMPQVNPAHFENHTFGNIIRPEFMSGTRLLQDKGSDTNTNIESVRNDGGVGAGLERENFIASDIRARGIFGLDALQVLSLEDAGILKTGLSGLSYKAKIKIPDPTDFSWLEEKDRLTVQLNLKFTNAGIPPNQIESLVAQELRRNPPFGRHQRTTNKLTSDIAGAKIDSSNKIKEILQEVKDNRINSDELKNQLISVLNKVDNVTVLTTDSRVALTGMIHNLNINSNFKAFFGPTQKQIVSFEWMNAGENLGKFNMFVLANIGTDTVNLSIENPIYSYSDAKWHPSKGIRVKKIDRAFYNAMNSGVSATKTYVDLYRRGTIKANQVKKLVSLGVETDLTPDETRIYTATTAVNYNMPPAYGKVEAPAPGVF